MRRGPVYLRPERSRLLVPAASPSLSVVVYQQYPCIHSRNSSPGTSIWSGNNVRPWVRTKPVRPASVEQSQRDQCALEPEDVLLTISQSAGCYFSIRLHFGLLI